MEIKKKERGRAGKSGGKPFRYSMFIKILYARSEVTEVTDRTWFLCVFFSTLGW